MNIPFFSKLKKRSEQYNEGISLYNEGKFADALEKFKSVIKSKSGKTSIHSKLSGIYSNRARYNLGVRYFSMGNYSEAAAMFETVAKHQPERADVYEYLGVCYNNMRVFDNAVNAFQKVMLLEPDQLLPKIKLRIVFHNLGMWKKSADICEELIEVFPHYANIHFHLGLSYLGQGKPKLAVSAFEKALKINPYYVECRLKLGITHAYLGNTYDAFFHLEALREEFPNYPDLWYFLGIFCSVNEKYEEASHYFGKAMEINPGFAEAGIKHALIKLKYGQKDEALQMLEETSRHAPENPHVKKIIDYIRPHDGKDGIFEGWFDNDMDDIVRAVKQFNYHIEIKPNFSEMISILRSISDDDASAYESVIPIVENSLRNFPNYPDNYCSLGALYHKIGKYKEAQTAFEKAIEMNPDYIQARLCLLKTLEKRKNYEYALANGELLLKKGVQDPDFYMTLGLVYAALEMTDKAEDVLQKALRQNPNYLEARYHLANLYFRQQRKDRAKAEFQACLTDSVSKSLKEKILKRLADFEK